MLGSHPEDMGRGLPQSRKFDLTCDPPPVTGKVELSRRPPRIFITRTKPGDTDCSGRRCPIATKTAGLYAPYVGEASKLFFLHRLRVARDAIGLVTESRFRVEISVPEISRDLGTIFGARAARKFSTFFFCFVELVLATKNRNTN